MTLTAKNANCYAMNRATNMVVTDFIPIVLRPELRLSGTASEDRGYTYDAAWNLNYRTNNGVTTTVTVDGLNQLSRFGFGDCYYDPNGNLTNSHAGKRTYVYDDENRLTELYVDDAVGNPDKATEFLYDGLGRLRIRREYTYNPPSFVGGDDWELNSETRYVYDGMRVIQERNGSNTPLVSYTRGTDLSGSLEGAGGIGGLLARSHGYSSGTGNWSTHNFYHADGNGNITYLVNSSQTLAARYRYDPYGNTISSSGTLASGNVYRFSSKEVHTLSGLYYYGYRWYEPNFQRWLNRDPVGEFGFQTRTARASRSMFVDQENQHVFVRNSPIGTFDPYGLTECTDACARAFGDRSRATDRLAKYALATSCPGAVAGFGIGAAKGRGFLGALAGTLIGPINALGIEIIGTSYAAVAYTACMMQCSIIEVPPPQSIPAL